MERTSDPMERKVVDELPVGCDRLGAHPGRRALEILAAHVGHEALDRRGESALADGPRHLAGSVAPVPARQLPEAAGPQRLPHVVEGHVRP